VHLDRRWNPVLAGGARARPTILSYLVPGCGFGGSCFPKDVQALRSQGESVDLPMHLLNAVLSINDAQPTQIATLLARHWRAPALVPGALAGKRILVLGLAFKPDTDDVRESASRRIISDLVAAGAAVLAHDPIAMPNAERSWPELARVELVDAWSEQLGVVDAVVVATRWLEYRDLLLPGPQRRLQGKAVVDARRFFRQTDFPSSTYLAIGFSRQSNPPPSASPPTA